jgi:hypothetical protein
MSRWPPYCTYVEVSTTRGTTALVYCLINSSLYTGTVHRWWSTPNWLDGHQGCSQLSTGPPRALALARRRRGQRSILWCGARRQDRYRVCGGYEGADSPGGAKTSSPGRKTVPGPSRGGAGEDEGEETSGSENKTRVVAARLPGREPGGLPRRRGLPGMASVAVQALRRLMATT